MSAHKRDFLLETAGILFLKFFKFTSYSQLSVKIGKIELGPYAVFRLLKI